jgi:hypothetical protein
MYKEDNVTQGIMDPDFYRRQAALHLQTAEKLDGMPMVDPFENGQILSFRKNWSGQKTYSYAAIKTEVGWFVTGDNTINNKVFSYDEVLSFIGISQFDTITVMNPGDSIKEWWSDRQQEKAITAKQSEAASEKGEDNLVDVNPVRPK